MMGKGELVFLCITITVTVTGFFFGLIPFIGIVFGAFASFVLLVHVIVLLIRVAKSKSNEVES